MALSYERLHNSFQTTLTAAVATTTATTISVAAIAPSWSRSGPLRVRIDNEIVYVISGHDTLTWTIVRGAELTTAATHSSGAPVTHIVTDVGLGNLVEQQRPNVPNLARSNTWGVKLRGVTPSAGLSAATSYSDFWITHWNDGGINGAALVDQQMAQAASVGANHVKCVVSPWRVHDGAATVATLLSRVEYWLDAAYRNGFLVTSLITDNIQSPITSTRATMAQEIAVGQQTAALLDQYPNVIGLDLLNEINGWQTLRGGPGTYAFSQPDATSLAWLQGPNSYLQAIRAVTSKPIGASFYVQDTTGLLSNTSSDWLYVLAHACDYLDLHPYWPTASDMPLSALQSLHALYPELAVYFGEVSVLGYAANLPEVKRRIESTRALIDQPYCPGATIYTLDDYDNPGGTGIGMFDQSGNERPNMSYPFRTWPRRAGYYGSQTIPLITPADPFPLQTTALPVPSAKFPLKASYYSTSLGDPDYRVHAILGEGIAVSDVLEATVYDLDTGLNIIQATGTVSTSGGPTTPDASSFGNPGSVVGVPTPSVVTGKFTSGIQIANSSQQIQWPNLFQPAGTQPFTIECWYKRSRLGVQDWVLSQWGDTLPNSSWAIIIGSDNVPSVTIVHNASGTTWTGTASTIADTTTFHHLAASYDGTNMRFFLDGTIDGSGTNALSLQTNPQTQIITASSTGTGPTAAPGFGVIDEVRISNIARYTAGFTPSAAAFTTDANTMLLAHLDTVAAASTNLTTTLGTEWQYVQPNSAVNAGVKFRNQTAARGAVLSAALEIRYA